MSEALLFPPLRRGVQGGFIMRWLPRMGPQPVPQVMGDLLGERAGVGEDDRRAVLVNGPVEAPQEPAVAQAAVGRLTGPEQALDGDLDRRRAGWRGSLDDAAASRRPDQEPCDR